MTAVRKAKAPPKREWHRGHPTAAKSLIATLAALVTGVPGYFGVKDIWQTKAEATEHAKKDDSRFAWVQFGFADLRAMFLEDHVFECNVKRTGKMAPTEVAVCARYDVQLSQAVQMVNTMKSEALSLTKESK